MTKPKADPDRMAENTQRRELASGVEGAGRRFNLAAALIVLCVALGILLAAALTVAAESATAAPGASSTNIDGVGTVRFAPEAPQMASGRSACGKTIVRRSRVSALIAGCRHGKRSCPRATPAGLSADWRFR